MNRTLLDECFRVAGWTTWAVDVHEIQGGLDQFLAYHNLRRGYQGYQLAGLVPAQALQEAPSTAECIRSPAATLLLREEEVIPAT
jgi:hypothetical protein